MFIKRNGFLFSPAFMAILFIILASVLAFATFVENNHGAAAARFFIYNTWWFELVFVLVLVNLIGQIIVLKLYKIKKLTVFIFHFAFALIIIGAAITRYTGIEGLMHIREGQESSRIEKIMNSKFENKRTHPEYIEIPFALKLEKFTIERYPGSKSPSSFKSDVIIIDKKNQVEKPFSIYMNHILKYKGYRFFQSSYDEDEKGTVLSVSKDRAGTMVTYAGYYLMIIFIILSLFNKNSSFRNVSPNFWKSKIIKSVAIIIFISFSSFSYSNVEEKIVIPKAQADEFGELLVQDQKGRTEPLYTLSNDIIRKISKKSTFDGLTSMQVFMGLHFDFEHWKDVSLIKVSNNEIAKIIGVNSDYAAFSDFINLEQNTYKLSNVLDIAYSKQPGARSKFDKEVIKIDERLNICFMIYRGDFLRIFPVNNNSKTWYSPTDAIGFAQSAEDSAYFTNILNLYFYEIINGNSNKAKEYLNSVTFYQKKFTNYELPSFYKIKAEILYYKSLIFERLFPFYATVGILLFVFIIVGIVGKGNIPKVLVNIASLFLFVGFLFHTSGLLIRWYVSGHAPMSNGYETMIFISWVMLLAGFIFRHKSPLVLAATALLSSLTLLVAHLSFMDPEITNLVPVLQSYWLTLHVSVITSSYAFLGLGAILGIINMVMYIVLNDKNKNKIYSTIDDLTVINYKSLTIGLYLLTIGTFLGAIWANESWGRYWGWDPKETWSLITIIVYSFVIHSRMMAIFRSIYVFNVMSLFAFFSVLMTYFGVNYYLSGLHSYASGDPVPVPVFIYVSVILLIMVSVLANWKYKKIKPV